MSQQELELPKGWVETKLGDIAIRLQAGGTPDTDEPTYYKNGTIPFVKIDDITDSKTKYLETTKIKITTTGLKNSSAWLVPKNLLLYSMYASYGLPIINKIEVATSQAIIVYQPPKDLIILDFIYYFLKFMGPFSVKKGTTQKNLNAKIVKNYQILLPPLKEQERIVSKIEELFLKIDSSKQLLEKTKFQLTQYKQSLLKSAFSGNLTKVWRQKNLEKIENIGDFINLIKKANNEKNHEFLEISHDFLDNVPDLPLEWNYVLLSNLGDLERGRSRHRPRNDPILFDGKYPFIQTGIVRNSNGKITSFKQTYNDVGLAQSRLFPTNTICITIAANIADSAVLTFPACFPDSVVGFNGFLNLINNKFILYYIQSIKSKLRSIAPSTAQKNINLEILQNILVPMMSYEEQKEIIRKIEHGFLVINNIHKNIDSMLQNMEILKISIFKKAFQGKLVPQNPNDESAEILLEKINNITKNKSVNSGNN
jgi:type I restriction enzyme, S subunit